MLGLALKCSVRWGGVCIVGYKVSIINYKLKNWRVKSGGKNNYVLRVPLEMNMKINVMCYKYP
jgi:hypothetical protein